MMQLGGLLLLFLLSGMLLACGAAATAPPTAASTASPVPSPTPFPTATAEAATAVTPQASATSMATPEPDPTKSPSAATTPVFGGTFGLPAGAAIKLGDSEFQVELAITSEEKVQGLSDRPTLAPNTGMLFIYEQQSRFSFWMRNMHFALDMVWIGADCTVADVTLNAPPPDPGQALNQLPRYRPEAPALYVLEINAGEAPAMGIKAGVEVAFTGDLTGRFGC